MPIQSTDTTSPIVFAGDHVTWLIKAGVGVVPPAGDAVVMAHASCLLTNLGTIVAVGDGVSLEGTAGDFRYGQVINGASGYISSLSNAISSTQNSAKITNQGVLDAYSGIDVNAGGNQVLNAGAIYAQNVGVAFQGVSNHLDNTGQIRGGNDAVYFASSTSSLLTIANSGSMSGAQAAVQIEGGGFVLHNTGEMDGDILAIDATVACSIVNVGLMDGVVGLGAGADLYDGRGGVVTGKVSGGGGSDTLIGGTGDDVLNGGAGVDKLDGGKGPGEDTFVFSTVADSTAKNHDVISRHWSASDTIDVHALDANASVSGNQDFVFGGSVAANASLAVGVIDYFQQNGNTYVVADTTGDGKADFEVVIHGTFALNADEFVL